MKAYVLAHITTGEVGEALRQIRLVRGVTHADMTFGPFDLIAMIEAQNLDALGHAVAWDIQTIPGVRDTITCLAVEPGDR